MSTPQPPEGGYHPPAYYSQPVYMAPAQPYPQNGMATAGLTLGIIAVIIAMIPFGLFFIWPASILAIIFGAIGHNKANQGWSTKKRESMIGWILGIVSIVVAPFFFWLYVAVLFAASTPVAPTGSFDACPDTPALVQPCDIY